MDAGAITYFLTTERNFVGIKKSYYSLSYFMYHVSM